MRDYFDMRYWLFSILSSCILVSYQIILRAHDKQVIDETTKKLKAHYWCAHECVCIGAEVDNDIFHIYWWWFEIVVIVSKFVHIQAQSKRYHLATKWNETETKKNKNKTKKRQKNTNVQPNNQTFSGERVRQQTATTTAAAAPQNRRIHSCMRAQHKQSTHWNKVKAKKKPKQQPKRWFAITPSD